MYALNIGFVESRFLVFGINHLDRTLRDTEKGSLVDNDSNWE